MKINMQKNIIVTGGSGFVGQKLIPILLKLPELESLINIDLISSNIKDPKLSNIHLDLRNLAPNSLNFLDQSKTFHLFHLAANIFNDDVPKRSSRKKFFLDTNFNGTKLLLDCLADKSINAISFLSTDMVYGTPQNVPISETDPFNSNGDYGDSKTLAENYIVEFSNSRNIPFYIFRPRLIIGPGRFGLLNKLFYLIKNDLPVPLIGSGNNRYQFISVFDCAKILAETFSDDRLSGIYNLGSQDPPKVRLLLEALIHEAQSSSFLVPTPAIITKSILSILDIMNLSLLYPEQYKIADLDYVLDTKKLIDEFSYHPKDTDTEMLIEAYQTYLNT